MKSIDFPIKTWANITHFEVYQHNLIGKQTVMNQGTDLLAKNATHGNRRS